MSEAVSEKSAVKEQSMKSALSLLNGYFDILDEKLDGARHYVSSGFDDLDSAFSAWLHDGHFVVVAARPAMGKTSLVQQIAEHVAREKTVLFYTLEMSGYELIERSISRRSGITVSRLKIADDLNDDDFARMRVAINELKDLPIYIDDGVYDIDSIFCKTSRIAAKINKRLSGVDQVSSDEDIDKETPLKPLGLVVVDYLQLIGGTGANRTIEIGDVSRKLKRLSKELKVPVVAIAQLNRSLESRQDKRPILSDLRESGQIEQDADSIFFVYRDEVYNADSPDKGVAEIICGKNRHGSIGVARLGWIGRFVKFTNLVKMPDSGKIVDGNGDDDFDW